MGTAQRQRNLTEVFYRASGSGGGSSHDLGWYATPLDLTTAHPTATDGDFAIVGSTDSFWVWDSDTSAWKDTGVTGSSDRVNFDFPGQTTDFITSPILLDSSYILDKVLIENVGASGVDIQMGSATGLDDYVNVFTIPAADSVLVSVERAIDTPLWAEIYIESPTNPAWATTLNIYLVFIKIRNMGA
jgi:hypothetical protein